VRKNKENTQIKRGETGADCLKPGNVLLSKLKKNLPAKLLKT
jgi:hypothetical protein